LQINPGNAAWHAQLALILYVQKKLKEAAAAYTESLRLQPNDPTSLYNLGVIYVSMNDRDSATVQYNKLKSLNRELAEKLSLLIKKGK